MKSLTKTVGSILASLIILTQAPIAFADSSAAAGSGSFASGMMGQMGLLGAFLLIFYFLIFHPQNKKAKEHREMITRLAKGDEIITNGGIVGKINRITDDFFGIMVAEGIEVLIQKQAVHALLPKGTMKSI